ncbi:MAG: DeoR/GlpR family DNA-binding transcription regulator [Pseudomonadota bacterium]
MTKQAERRSIILDILSKQPRASVETLCESTGASAATVRRDLQQLAERGEIERIRGGAQSAGASPALNGTPFQRNFTVAVPEKRAIAKAAAEMTVDGETIIVDAGTTTYFMCPYLAGRNLQVLTNSLPIVDELLSDSTVRLHVPAGQVYREQNIILSPFEEDGTSGYAATKMFMGAYAVTELGVEQVDAILVQAEQRLLSRARELIVLADSRKLRDRGGMVVTALGAVSRVITDEGADEAIVRHLEDEGVAVTIVSPQLSR